jgi:hypothetical protein
MESVKRGQIRLFFAGFYVMIKKISLGELVRQAERKLKISTLIPDADNAAVGNLFIAVRQIWSDIRFPRNQFYYGKD